MAAKHAGAGGPGTALGGSPFSDRDASDAPDDKGTRKQRKSDHKLREDAERPPESFERFRILMEVVDQGRRVVDLADNKARHALAMMGVLNAGVFILVSRFRLTAGLGPSLRPWLIAAFVIYAGLSFYFMLHAIDCLRPRQLASRSRPDETEGSYPAGAGRPLGLLYWESIATQELEAYGRAWSSVRMEQLIAEQVVIGHRLSLLIRAKYVALSRLYWGLSFLVGFVALLLAAYAALGLLGDGAPGEPLL
jgi:hypothetical protein